MTLKSGHFYLDAENMVWCCFQIDTYEHTSEQAKCVRIKDSQLKDFAVDGKSKDGPNIFAELPFKDVWVDETYHVRWRL
jgi:hypothetical protein